MANRLVNGVYVLDTSASTLTWPSKARIVAVTLYGTDSTARLTLASSSNVANSVFALANPVNSPNLVGMTIPGGTDFPLPLQIVSLIAGTGYIYFG